MKSWKFWAKIAVTVALWLPLSYASWSYWDLPTDPGPKYINPALKPYYDSFKDIARDLSLAPGNEIQRIEVSGPLEQDNWVGVCRKIPIRTGLTFKYYYYIEIPKIYDNRPNAMMAIMFHELAHCVYDLPHVDDPQDLMYFEIDWGITFNTLTQQIGDMFELVKNNQRK